MPASCRVKWPTIKFVGVWDTVASVIVPRPDRFYLAEPADAGLRASTIPAIEIFRQAIVDRREAPAVPAAAAGGRAENSGRSRYAPQRQVEPAGFLADLVRRRACRYRRRLSGNPRVRCRNTRCCG